MGCARSFAASRMKTPRRGCHPDEARADDPMGNVRQHPSARKARHYASLTELRAGVRAVCLEHVAASGGVWTAASEAFLKASVLGGMERLEARKVAAQLRAAIGSALAFAAQHSEATDEPGRTIVAAATVLGPLEGALAGHAEGAWWSHLEPRVALVLEHGRPDQWWWKGPAKGRDLAVLSLLADNWPNLTATVEQCSDLDVLRAEERALNHVRSRHPTTWRP